MLSYTLGGWPGCIEEVPLQIREFFWARGHLSASNGFLTYDDRIVIPAEMRDDILGHIHLGHQGVTKCRERANQSVWWPGISKEIQKKIELCNFCQTNQPTQKKEPLMTTPIPDRPWQKVSSDLFELEGRKYLVIMDYYSRFIEILSLLETTSRVVILKLKSVFPRWGIPEELVSDNGPQYRSGKFDEFKEQYGFKHTTSSPHHHQANGAAESAVQTAKRILEQEDPFLALMAYQATPIPATKMTPSQLIMGRLIHTTLPMMTKGLEPVLPDHAAVKEADDKAKENYRKTYNRRNNVNELPELQPGDFVRTKLDNEKGWNIRAKVVALDQNPRSYIVDTGGRTLQRNRRYLKKEPTGLDLPVEESNDPEVSSQPVQKEDAVTPENNKDTPTEAKGTVPEQRTSSGRLIKMPIRYREDT